MKASQPDARTRQLQFSSWPNATVGFILLNRYVNEVFGRYNTVRYTQYNEPPFGLQQYHPLACEGFFSDFPLSKGWRHGGASSRDFSGPGRPMSCCPTRSQKTVRLLDFLAPGRLIPAFASFPPWRSVGPKVHFVNSQKGTSLSATEPAKIRGSKRRTFGPKPLRQRFSIHKVLTDKDLRKESRPHSEAEGYRFEPCRGYSRKDVLAKGLRGFCGSFSPRSGPPSHDISGLPASIAVMIRAA